MKQKQLYMAGILVLLSGFIVSPSNAAYSGRIWRAFNTLRGSIFNRLKTPGIIVGAAAIVSTPDSDQVVPLMTSTLCERLKTLTDSRLPQVTIERRGTEKCVRREPGLSCNIREYYDPIDLTMTYGSVQAVIPDSQQANEALKRSRLSLKGVSQQSIIQDILLYAHRHPTAHKFWTAVHKASQQEGVQLIFGSRIDLADSNKREEFFQKSLDNITNPQVIFEKLQHSRSTVKELREQLAQHELAKYTQTEAAKAAMKKGYRFGRIANNLF